MAITRLRVREISALPENQVEGSSTRSNSSSPIVLEILKTATAQRISMALSIDGM